MIPKQLKIKGFFSYKTETFIDFRPLSEVGLFGIFGKVGSGKSAILEAIMLAIYGEVERIGGKGQRNYNLMNLESDELLIDFEFEAAQQQYRSNVQAKRNKKKFEDVGTYKTSFYIKENNEWKPIHNFDAAAVIGLKAEEFKKTIVIPQNTFQHFLQMGETERTRMMRDLFGLEKYDLSAKIKKLNDNNNSQLEANNAQIGEQGNVNENIIEENKLKIIDLEKNINVLKLQIENLRQQEAAQKKLQMQFEELRKYENLAQGFALQAAEMQAKEQQIQDLEYCQMYFKTPLEKLNDAQQSLEQKNKTWHQKEKALKIKEKELQEKEKAFEILTPQYENRATLQRKADELDCLQKVVALSAKIKEVKQRIEKGKNLIQKYETEATQLQENWKTAQVQRENLQEKFAELSVLYELKNWFLAKNNILKNTERIGNEINTHQEKTEGIEINKKRLVTGVLPTVRLSLSESLGIAEVIKQVQEQRKAGRKLNEQIELNIQHLHRAKPLAALAADLSQGEPCPLCGATHHPSVFDEDRTKHEISELTKQKKMLQKEDLTLENVERELITNIENLNMHRDSKKRLEQERRQELQNLEEHNTKFSWKSYSSYNENLIDEKIKTANNCQEEAKLLDKKIKREQQQLEKLQQDILKYQKGLQELAVTLKELETTQKNEKERIQMLENITIWLTKSEVELAEQAKKWRIEVQQIEQKYQDLQKNKQVLERDMNVLRGAIETLQKACEEDELKILHTENLVSELLIKSYFGDVKIIQNILNKPFDLEKARKEITVYKRERYAIEQQLAQLREALNGQAFETSAFQTLLKTIKTFENELNTHNQQLGEYRNQLNNFLYRLEKIKALQKVRENLVERGKNLEVLRGVFKSSAFVNYVSYIYMKNICDIANARFERFTQYRLRLELDKNNNFLIRDRLNGGKTRSVQTLSGGQLFQASLALALALADSIQRLTKNRQNFFFLDEGFGSLDSDSLQLVFETLKALRQENRVVGIISHVDTMQQEIERYLNVWLDEKLGSCVKLEIGQ